MRTYVVDTSVALAWYFPDVFATAAREWRDQWLGGRIELIAPPLHRWEMANVLRTYVRRGEIGERLAQDIYRVHLDAPLRWVEADPERVLRTALDYDATAYDAVFIQLSLAHHAPLLTAERTTTPWVVRLGKLAIVVGAAGHAS